MRIIFRGVLALLLLLSVSFVALVVYITDEQAEVEQQHYLDASSARETQRVLRRVMRVVKRTSAGIRPHNVMTFVFSESELQGLSALAHRAIPQLTSQASLSETSVDLIFTYDTKLPQSWRYINIDFKVYANHQGMVLSDVTFGSLTLSGDYFLKLLSWFSDFALNSSLGSEAINSLHHLRIFRNKAVLTMKLPPSLENHGEDKLLAFKQIRDELALFGDVEKIKAYYASLMSFSRQLSSDTSLSRYLSFILSQAAMQTLNTGEENAVEENRTALTALALFFGSEKFALLVTDLEAETNREKSRRRLLKHNVTLHERVDLQKHYIYSMALKLLGNVQSSDAIGEMKEFIDSNRGGSGFSFVDLMADRAGTRLADLATLSIESALYIQQLAEQGLRDEDLLPEISGLPEGLTQAEFEREYQDINSAAYQQMLLKLDGNIMQLPLYQIDDFH